MTEIRIHHGHLRAAEEGMLDLANSLAGVADNLDHISETIREQVGNMSEPVDRDLVDRLMRQIREDMRMLGALSVSGITFNRGLMGQMFDQRPDDLDPHLPCTRCKGRNTFAVDEDGPTATCTECGWQLSAPSWAMLTRLIRMHTWGEEE